MRQALKELRRRDKAAAAAKPGADADPEPRG